MLKNFIPARTEYETIYYFEFLYDDDSGYSFPTDKDGVLLKLTEEQEKSYQYCLQNIDKFQRIGQRKFIRKIKIPAEGDCICGAHIELYDAYHGSCSCPNCDRWYNLFGQELLPPEYWEDDEEYDYIDYDPFVGFSDDEDDFDYYPSDYYPCDDMEDDTDE